MKLKLKENIVKRGIESELLRYIDLNNLENLEYIELKDNFIPKVVKEYMNTYNISWAFSYDNINKDVEVEIILFEEIEK